VSGIWWSPQLFSKKLKPVEKKEKQKWMRPSDKLTEIEVELSDGPDSDPVHIKLVPEGVGQVDGFTNEKIDPVKSAESGDEEEEKGFEGIGGDDDDDNDGFDVDAED
jgi:hypothetical protein